VLDLTIRIGPVALLGLAGLLLVGAATARPEPPPTPRPAAHAVGPPAGRTGGFGEPTCTECHIGSEPNTPGSTLEVAGLDDGYVPGEPIRVTVRLDSFDMLAAGFQAAFRRADGTRAGEVRALDDRVAVVDSAGIAYVQHTASGARAGGEHAEWTFEWTPPADGGAVALHVAANSANGDNSPLDDLIYTLGLRLGPRGDPTAAGGRSVSGAPSASRSR